MTEVFNQEPPNRVPSLRISTAHVCNHKCAFCQVEGDFSSEKGEVETGWLDAVMGSVRDFHRLGVRSFSITGGEPLLAPHETFEVARLVDDLIGRKGTRRAGYLRINTNGVFLDRFLPEVVELFDLVKVSLHTLSVEAYAKTTNSRRYSEDFTDVLSGISNLGKLGQKVRIQTVVTRENIDDIWGLIEFCETQENVTELKLFDVSQYKNLWHGKEDGFRYWRKQYVDIEEFVTFARANWEYLGLKFSRGGYGNPMPQFQTKSGLLVRFRLSNVGAFYSGYCKKCVARSWCKDGHCNLEVGPNKIIKVCRPREGAAFSLGDEQNALNLFYKTAWTVEGEALHELELVPEESPVEEIYLSDRKRLESHSATTTAFVR